MPFDAFTVFDRAPPTPRPTSTSRKADEAPLYVADDELKTALGLAVITQQPLLLTGDPGCGKTGAAYWAAWVLGADAPIHVQVRSDSSAHKLRYEFDAVEYFRASQTRQPGEVVDRSKFVVRGPLWRAFEQSHSSPVVLLLDEVDKAPRDFPNDLLHEFDALEFYCEDAREADGTAKRVHALRGLDQSAEDGVRGLGLVLLTSNSERKLSDAFLRRCVHHHVVFDVAMLNRVVERRMKARRITLQHEIVKRATELFLELRDRPGLAHPPGLGEFLVWLEALSKVARPDYIDAIEQGKVPLEGLLLKVREDRTSIG